MKTIELKPGKPTLQKVLEMASEENVVLRTSDGREFVLAEIDDFGDEIALMRENKELMAFLDERSKSKGKYSLAEVRKMLKLDERPNGKPQQKLAKRAI